MASGTRISTGTARRCSIVRLQSFYVEVNSAARDGQKVLATLDDARCMRYLKGYIARMDAQLRSAD